MTNTLFFRAPKRSPKKVGAKTALSFSPKSKLNRTLSLSIVEDDSQRMTASGPQPADPMTQIHPIRPAGSLHRPMMHRKGNRIALTKRHTLRSRLHPRTLLRQHKLAATKILSRLREQNRHLDRED